MIHVRQAPEEQRIVIEFTGVLDARGADELSAIALQQPHRQHLELDLSRAEEIDAAALRRLIASMSPFRSFSLREPGARAAAAMRSQAGASRKQQDEMTDDGAPAAPAAGPKDS